MLNILTSTMMFSQSSPLWTSDSNTLPDSATLFPINTASDGNSNFYVLSKYNKYVLPQGNLYKIYLKKYNENGALLWSLIFDNGGIGEPKPISMCIDNNGDCYVAGGLMGVPSFKPFLMKVSSSGNILWQRDSLLTFSTGTIDKILFKNNLLYLQGHYGIAILDLNGNEKWSSPVAARCMTVDDSGRMIVGTFANPINTFHAYDSTGTLIFEDSTFDASKITTDSNNNIYMLTDFPNYQLSKYDSNGVFQWHKDSFPAPPTFGDYNFEVLTDYNNDVILLGLSDTMYKFTTDGSLIWMKSMNGLDQSGTIPKIHASNILFIAGSINNDVVVRSFDLNGNQNWSALYNSNPTHEFSVDMVIDNTGIYVVADSLFNTIFIKFESPFFVTTIDYSLICVESINYDSINPDFININVFNGNISHLNYPVVQVISPTGDTIVNPDVNFFAHLGNTYQTYHDSISVFGITDFSNYTFVMNESFGVSTGTITFCQANDISENELKSIILYPNPVYENLSVVNLMPDRNYTFELYEISGKQVSKISINGSTEFKFDLSCISSGLYILSIKDLKGVKNIKIIKN